MLSVRNALQNQTSIGVHRKPNGRRRGRKSLVIVLVFLVIGFLVSQRPPEPSYAGKTLTQWLLNTNANWVWIPNDVYGHIHDELWSQLWSPPEVSGSTRNELGSDVMGQDSGTNFTGAVSWKIAAPPGELCNAVRHIGANGIPRLLELISSRPSLWTKLRGAIAERLPEEMGAWFYPGDSLNSVERKQAAAFDGFTILGTNAEPALPALSNLLFGAEVNLPLTWAIANIGPKGIALLTSALSRTNSYPQREGAALALGLKYQQARSAVPALVDCVERGQASYDVLGALGRIGCDDPRLVPALVRQLELSPRANPTLDITMAFLLLGLQGEKARVAAPLVIAEYRLLEGDPIAAAKRRFHRRILRAIAPDLEAQLPPRPPDEESGTWP